MFSIENMHVYVDQSYSKHDGFTSHRKLAAFDTWSRLAVHVAMDNTVIIEEISKLALVS